MRETKDKKKRKYGRKKKREKKGSRHKNKKVKIQSFVSTSAIHLTQKEPIHLIKGISH
jgi:hypothetical protein